MMRSMIRTLAGVQRSRKQARLEALDPDVMLDAMIESFEGDEKKLVGAI
jgi:hypothetical protein